MARNNLIWIKGDITGDIYYDLFKLDSQGHPVSAPIFNGQGGLWGGRRDMDCGYVCMGGPLAQLVYGHLRIGSRLGVIGHLQQRKTHKGDLVFEVVAQKKVKIYNQSSHNN